MMSRVALSPKKARATVPEAPLDFSLSGLYSGDFSLRSSFLQLFSACAPVLQLPGATFLLDFSCLIAAFRQLLSDLEGSGWLNNCCSCITRTTCSPFLAHDHPLTVIGTFRWRKRANKPMQVLYKCKGDLTCDWDRLWYLHNTIILHGSLETHFAMRLRKRRQLTRGWTSISVPGEIIVPVWREEDMGANNGHACIS